MVSGQGLLVTYICRWLKNINTAVAQGGDKKTVPYTTLETGNLPGRSTYLPISAGSRPTRLKKGGNERHSPWDGAHWL